METIDTRWMQTEEEAKSPTKFRSNLDLCLELTQNLDRNHNESAGRAIFAFNKALRYASNIKELKVGYLLRTQLLETFGSNVLASNIALIRKHNLESHSDCEEVAIELDRMEKKIRLSSRAVKNMQTKLRKKKKDPYQADSRSCLKLSYDPHSNVPWIASALKIVRHEEGGHIFVASRNLRVGDIVAIVKPLMVVDRFKEYQLFCISCFRFGY